MSSMHACSSHRGDLGCPQKVCRRREWAPQVSHLRAFLSLQLLQPRECGSQQLQDDGGIDVRHNACMQAIQLARFWLLFHEAPCVIQEQRELLHEKLLNPYLVWVLARQEGSGNLASALGAYHCASHNRGSLRDWPLDPELYLGRRCQPWKLTPPRAYQDSPGSPGSAQPLQSAPHPPPVPACTPPASKTPREAAEHSPTLRACCHARAVAGRAACMEGPGQRSKSSQKHTV